MNEDDFQRQVMDILYPLYSQHEDTELVLLMIFLTYSLGNCLIDEKDQKHQVLKFPISSCNHGNVMKSTGTVQCKDTDKYCILLNIPL